MEYDESVRRFVSLRRMIPAGRATVRRTTVLALPSTPRAPDRNGDSSADGDRPNTLFESIRQPVLLVVLVACGLLVVLSNLFSVIP